MRFEYVPALVADLNNLASHIRSTNQRYLNDRHDGITIEEARLRWSTPEQQTAIQADYALWLKSVR